jgi:RNA polymerase subunit RPABC4/transcription elongation factor Spt4
MFKICPSCQYIAMREHESTCPICNGALAQRDLVGAISLKSSFFAHSAQLDQPLADHAASLCHFHTESTGSDWTLQSSTTPVLSQL